MCLEVDIRIAKNKVSEINVSGKNVITVPKLLLCCCGKAGDHQ